MKKLQKAYYDNLFYEIDYYLHRNIIFTYKLKLNLYDSGPN